jgi:hypothetical protein
MAAILRSKRRGYSCMSAVVLRCPNCGTTQSTQGECEACHEGQVGYYCTNHKPGRWLDGPECSQCHAVYGREEPPPPAPPRPTRPTHAPPPRKGSIETRRPPRIEVPRHRPDPWVRRPSPPPSREVDHASEETRARERMIEMLNELLRRGHLGRRPPIDMDIPSPPPMQQIPGGCLRIVLFFLLFLLLSYLGNWLMFSF